MCVCIVKVVKSFFVVLCEVVLLTVLMSRNPYSVGAIVSGLCFLCIAFRFICGYQNRVSFWSFLAVLFDTEAIKPSIASSNHVFCSKMPNSAPISTEMGLAANNVRNAIRGTKVS